MRLFFIDKTVSSIMQICDFSYTFGLQISKKDLCGIAGIWSSENLNRRDLEKLTISSSAIARRGPDAEGVYSSERSALSHRRLSIIDTDERANQPMRKGPYSLVYNGEIYNFRELRKLLRSEYGAEFRTASDTEVLLHGLINEGPGFIKKLNGFFAFAFYDERNHHILIARDRFGIKPLVYAHRDNRFYFGSGLGTIMPFLERPEIDGESLSLYLGLSYIPAPKTILQGVSKLEPGYFLSVDSSGLKCEEYYEVSAIDKKDIGYEEAKKELKIKLEDSVQKRLVSDVPLGTFLSGGVDSSVISLLASRHKKDIPAFSIGFPDQPYFDESQRAAVTAKHLGLDHHVVEVREKDLDEHLEDILSAMDEPFADSSGILVNLLSEFAAKYVKVALSGDGADELLGGYNKHRGLLRSIQPDWKNKTLKRASGALGVLPSSRNKKRFNQVRKLQRYSRGLNLNFRERYLEWACFTPEERVSEILRSHHRYSESEVMAHYLDKLNEERFNSVLKTDFSLVLSNDMLCKVDGMSMHRSLEVRVPFLDHDLVDFVFSMPSEYKLNQKSGKLLLKEAFAEGFQEGFFDHSKKGFEAPLTHWFRGPLRERIEKYFDRQIIEDQGLFEYEAVRTVIRKALGRSPGDYPHTLWALLVFQYWYFHQFITSARESSPCQES